MIQNRQLVRPTFREAKAARALQYINENCAKPACKELAFWLAFDMGLRCHEILCVELASWFEAGSGTPLEEVTIPRSVSKYCQERTVQVTPRVREALIRFRSAYPGALALRDAAAEQTSGDLRNSLESICASIGYDDLYMQHTGKARQMRNFTASNVQFAPSDGFAASSLAEKRVRSVHKAKRTTFRQSDIVRAVKALAKAGLQVTTTEISSDGSIRLSHGPAPADPAVTGSASAYEQWKEQRNARRP